MTSNAQPTSSTTTITDSLLFVAEAFFLPPKLPNALPAPQMSSMNNQFSPFHPWVAFNRSLASLCTLKESGNNVFGVMLHPFGQSESKSSESERREKIRLQDVEKVRFLCADNWGWPANDTLQPYVNTCFEKILAMSEEAEIAGSEGRVAGSQVIKDFIAHVYKNGWSKFCARMTKSNNRGHRLLDLLQRRHFLKQRHPKTPSNPPNLSALIDAVSRALDIIKKSGHPSNSESDYSVVHEACTQVYKQAFEDSVMNDWLNNLRLRETKTPGSFTPLRILQKMVKLRNGIGNIMVLVYKPEMRRTFQGARAAKAESPGTFVTWVSAPLSMHATFEVDLQPNTTTGIKSTYDAAIKGLSSGKREMYASTEEMWQHIQTDMKHLRYDPNRAALSLDHPGVFTIRAASHKQHCEGKLVRYVIDNNLLGKVFPYIGCSKRCCEPCFTAIRAVNVIIRDATVGLGRPDTCFAVADTHRKVYPGWGITLIKNPRFKQLIDGFNTLLCLDIGLVVKAGSGKGFGDSDSAPEPDPPVQ